MAPDASGPGIRAADLPEWLTINEVCAYLRIGRMTLWKIRNRGEIKSYYPSGMPKPGAPPRSYTVRFDKREIVEWLKGRGVKQ